MVVCGGWAGEWEVPLYLVCTVRAVVVVSEVNQIGVQLFTFFTCQPSHILRLSMNMDAREYFGVFGVFQWACSAKVAPAHHVPSGSSILPLGLGERP
jgi:hypothetical protein